MKVTKALLVLLLCALAPVASARHARGAASGSAPALQITTASLASPTVGTAYAQALTASGGSGTGYIYNEVAAYPNDQRWSYITPSGTISGTPQTAEIDTVTYQVTDSANNTAQKTFTLPVASSGGMAILSGSTLPAAVSGGYYAYQILIEGGKPPYYCAGTSVQPWSITQDCWIEGTPTATGTVALGTITVYDTAGSSVSFAPSVTVGSTLTLADVDPVDDIIRAPRAIAGQYYQAQFNAYGGSGTGYAYTATAGLPAWATLSTAGRLSGIPTTSGNVEPTIKVTDSASNTASTSALINVSSAARVSRPSYNSSTANGFFVLNGQLYDPNGYPFMMHGLDRNHFDSTSWAGGTDGALSGTNAVRIFMDQYDSPAAGNTMAVALNQHIDNAELPILAQGAIPIFVGTGSTSGTTLTVTAVNYGALVVGASVWLPGLPYYTTISSFGTGTGGTGTYTLNNSATISSTSFAANSPSGGPSGGGTTGGDTSTADLASVVNWWVQMEPVFAPYMNEIVVNIANEWGGSENATVSDSQWVSSYESAISAMRTAGYTCPIAIDFLSNGQGFAGAINGGYAASVLAADPLKNVLFDAHLYATTDELEPISGITQATNAVITVSATSGTNPFASIGYVYLSGIAGMTQANGQFAQVTGTGGSSGAWTVTTNLNTSTYSAYASGGIAYDSDYYTVRMSQLGAAIASDIPVMIGEFGPPGQNGTTAALSQFTAAALAYGVPELDWAWDDSNGSGLPWTGWFNDIYNASGEGTYALPTPSDLSQAGLDVVLNPRSGLMTTGVPAMVFH